MFQIKEIPTRIDQSVHKDNEQPLAGLGNQG